MGRKDKTPEEKARRAKIRELLQESNISSMEDIQNFARINDQSKLVIIPGASHRFLEEGAWDMVLDLTRDWFEFRQVLLIDSI